MYIEITGAICLLVVAAYTLGDPLAVKCLNVSYQVESLNQYDKGYNDWFFIAFWVVAFTFLRVAAMKLLFRPTAQLFNIKSFSKRERFAEQGWSFTYYIVFWSYGMVNTQFKVIYIIF